MQQHNAQQRTAIFAENDQQGLGKASPTSGI